MEAMGCYRRTGPPGSRYHSQDKPTYPAYTCFSVDHSFRRIRPPGSRYKPGMLSGHIGHPKKAAILTDKGRQAMDTRANLPEGPGLPYRREESPSQGIYQAFRRERTIRQKCGHFFRLPFFFRHWERHSLGARLKSYPGIRLSPMRKKPPGGDHDIRIAKGLSFRRVEPPGDGAGAMPGCDYILDMPPSSFPAFTEKSAAHGTRWRSYPDRGQAFRLNEESCRAAMISRYIFSSGG